MAREILDIKVSQLRPDPDQPRRDFDGAPSKETTEALRSLAENIKENGVLEPLLVRKGEGRWDYIIVAGERRWRASKLAGLERVPCLVQEDREDDQLRLVKQLSENIQREELSPLDIARSLKKALDTFPISQRQLAKSLGKHETWVSRHLQMLVAEGPAKDALELGLIDGYTTFNALMALPPEKQQALLAEALSRGEKKIPKSVLVKAAAEVQGAAEAPVKPHLKYGAPSVDWETGRGLPAGGVPQFSTAPKPKGKADAREQPVLRLDTRLQVGQAKRLLRMLNEEIPRDEFSLVPRLIEALRNLPSD
ncbi:ParB/RepB/Spo0J family partition protein [Ramlibacter alkalitolerans]|uniref:ParB/RepB/Spo0J family partition protein n=1 Tax=Ramlibacter alkalitolerans TaxID=2039631 RepID=A0ABS1JU38_9BURK|nr:ParB/RepB/Spo0J family partition protein [Ramlibacter alkalitolerans]MBL0427805.1 ParB/RepB/Spo0J family partition protein [Ramlibacter alkalitolerans]